MSPRSLVLCDLCKSSKSDTYDISHNTKHVLTLIPKSFDKNAALRFSLAFQCIVNIGVHSSKLIQSRVIQVGTLNVVGCILKSQLMSKGTLFCCRGMLFR